MNSADARLIEQVHQVTQGGARLLVSLARRGKAIQQSQPERAAFLLAAVGTHPLYKGGRLAFDMMEIEDLILDSSPVVSMSTQEVIQILTLSARHLAEALRGMGSSARQDRMAAEVPGRDSDVLGTVRFSSQSAGEPTAAAQLPRLTLGPTDDVATSASALTARNEGLNVRDIYPELRSCDYLYDYVVLGLLDAVSSISTSGKASI